MSWQSANDPAAGDASACDVIEAIIVSRTRDLGNFSVRPALPLSQRRMVGPFIFDRMGPTEFALGTGINVRPHPHISLVHRHIPVRR